MANVTLEEMETHLNMTGDNRKQWELATNDDVWIARIEKLGIKPTKIRGETRWYTLTDKHVSIHTPRQLSDEQRTEIAVRLARKRTPKQRAP